MSKASRDVTAVISLEGTCLLSRRHPAYRRRESDPGANVERGKLRPRNCGTGDRRSHQSREEDPKTSAVWCALVEGASSAAINTAS